MVNTPTILNINGTGPALLHIPTDTAHVLLELYPGQNLRLTPYPLRGPKTRSLQVRDTRGLLHRDAKRNIVNHRATPASLPI